MINMSAGHKPIKTRQPGALEFVCNIVPSPEDSRDYVYQAALTPKAKEKLAKKREVCDHRPEMLPVVNQGSVGSCAAQTAAAIKEWQESMDQGVNSKKSAHFVYDNRKNKNSTGMYCRDLMKILAKKGIPEEFDWPYRRDKADGEKIKEIPEDVYERALNNRTKSYYRVDTIEDLEDTLRKHGPCMVASPVYNHGMEMWKPEYPEQKRIGGHAMTVVGFIKDKDGDRFVIRNSWGSRWGDRGHTYLYYEDFSCVWEFWACIDDISKPVKESWAYRWKKAVAHVKDNALVYASAAVTATVIATSIVLNIIG